MKKMYYFVSVLFIMGISAVYGQTNQILNEGQVFTANLAAGAVHTYRVQFRTAPVYIIAWEDGLNNDNPGYADDIIIRVRHSEGVFYSGIIESDDGNFDLNRLRLIDIKNLAAVSETFIPNNWYIIEVRGYERSTSGTYKIVFF